MVYGDLQVTVDFLKRIFRVEIIAAICNYFDSEQSIDCRKLEFQKVVLLTSRA